MNLTRFGLRSTLTCVPQCSYSVFWTTAWLVLHLPPHDSEHRSSLTALTCVIVMGGCGSTALRSRTVGRCAGWGSPRSEQARGSETTAASASSSQGAPSSWAVLCELRGAEKGGVMDPKSCAHFWLFCSCLLPVSFYTKITYIYYSVC